MYLKLRCTVPNERGSVRAGNSVKKNFFQVGILRGEKTIMVASFIRSGFRKTVQKLNFLADDRRFTLYTTRDIFRLIIPLFFEQLLFMLVGSADKLMVAGLGEAAQKTKE